MVTWSKPVSKASAASSTPSAPYRIESKDPGRIENMKPPKTNRGPSRGALDGIRIVDVSRALAGPFSTMLMADLGADVIKLEMPGTGDESRYWGPPFATYMSSNRNKRSVAVDLHTDEGQKICLDLIRGADVLVENFRPGTMKRFNLDYD